MRTLFLSIAIAVSLLASAQASDPWKKEQLVKPAQLAEEIKPDAKNKPVIFNVGPMGQIKGAIKIGAVSDPKQMAIFKAEVDKIQDKNTPVVVYCGCCTSQNCPNIRPAFTALSEKGFKHIRVLEIEHGYVEDWQGKDFPVEK